MGIVVSRVTGDKMVRSRCLLKVKGSNLLLEAARRDSEPVFLTARKPMITSGLTGAAKR